MSDLSADIAGDASTAAAAPSITFKKKGGAKRKEFRAPAASLAARTDAVMQPPPEPAQPASASEPVESANTAAAAIGVSVEDDTHNDEDAAPSTVAATATARAAVEEEDDDSSDDDGAPRPSIALSAADAAAAAAAIEEEDPEEDGKDGVQRPSKRARKENPLVQSTRNRLKKDAGLTIQSTRSVLPDMRTADKQITQDVESSKVKRDANKPKWSGPTKPQASNVRMISRFDYQPDICKDYKETGRCGYGDSCKFMHDRGDYKAGWQIEKEWNEEQEVKRKRMLQGLSGEAEEQSYEIKQEEALPWACSICRQPFTNPVVTKCKHYFCEKCALDYYAKDTKCFDCRVQTGGIFNTASELQSVINKRAATGKDPRAELEKLEQERLAEKARISAQS